jgi:hypothetical protein
MDFKVTLTIWKMQDAGFLPIQIRVFLQHKFKIAKADAIELMNREQYFNLSN